MKVHIPKDVLRVCLLVGLWTSVLGSIWWVFRVPTVQAADFAHSGRLTEISGQPLEGPVSLKIRFYREETGGTALGPLLDFPTTGLSDGVYRVQFSLSSTEISDIFGRGDILPVYLEVEVNGSVMGRQRYLPIPFALRVPVDNNTMIFNAEGKLQIDTISESQVSGLTAKLSSLMDPPTARTNLGLGSLATASAVSSSQISDGAISNDHINAAAGIHDSKLATITSPGKVSGDAITSGTISGTTAIQTSGAVSVANVFKLVPGGPSPAELRFVASDAQNYVALKAPASLSSTSTWTLPSVAGGYGQVLTTDGSGVLSWSSPVGLGTVTSVGLTSSGGGISVSGSPVTGSGLMSLSLSDDLLALEGLSTTGVAERTGSNAWSTFPVTVAGKALLDDGDIATQRATLGLGVLATAASVSGGSGGTISDGTITNDDISAAAAIDSSKISGLSGALSGKEPTVASGTDSQYYRGDKTWQTLNTTAVAEGTNQYFTPSRARSALGVAGDGLTYNTATGVIGLPQASGGVAGYLSAGDFNTFNDKQSAITETSVVSGGTFTTALQNGVELRPYGVTAGQTGELRFVERGTHGTNYVGLRAPDAIDSDKIWTLPASDGTNGQVLSTNGSGVLTWITRGTGSVTSVGITTAPASGITVSGSPVTGSGSITLGLSDDLAAVEGLSGIGGVERTAANTWGTYNLTPAGKALLDDVDSAAQRTTLGLGVLATAAAVSGGNAGTITDGTITNDDISATADIDQSKILGLTGALSGKEPTVALGSDSQYYRGDKTWQTLNTTVVAEGTNQYFTQERARSAVSVLGAPLIYDSGTGVLSLAQASGSGSGFLSSSDFLAFHAKQAAITATSVVNSGTVTTALQNGIELKPYGTTAGQTGELRFAERGGNGTNYVGLRAPDSVATDRIWTLPAADGGSGQVLSTDGNGVLSWISPGGGGTVTSVGITTAPASGITVSGSPVTGSGSITLGLSDDLAAVEGLSGSGGVERTAANTWGTYTLSAAGKALIDDADNAAQRTTLGLGVLATAAAVSGGNAGTITDGTITNDDISTTAAIDQTKISGLATALTGKHASITGTSVVNGGTFTSALQNGLEVNPYGTSVGQTGEVRFSELSAQGTNYVGFKAPDGIVANRIWTLPEADGTSGQVLSTNGGGVLSWSTVSAGGGGSLTFDAQSADYTITTADKGKYFIVTGPMTTLTLPSAASAGTGFSVTVKSQGGWAVIAMSGSDTLEGDTTSIALPTLSVVQLGTDGTNWYVIYGLGVSYRGTPVACALNNCYTTSAAMTAGLAYTSTLGKVLVLENGVWVQANGNNVLNVDGSDTWHLALNANGRSQSATNLNKNLAKLGGRVCPTTVYVSDANKTATGRCLYYDQGSAIQRLGNSNTTDQTTTFTLGNWDTAVTGGGTTAANWYEGNIKYCADKGMRLPVLYETTANKPTSNLPTDFTSPTFSTTTGVPSYYGDTWTSSASGNTNAYWLWTGTSANSGTYPGTYAVRCVVP